MADPTNFIGKQIGNYRVVAEINSGGFATVYQAQHLTLHERVIAIKLLHAHLSSAKDREQFLQEAQFLEKLRHRYILSVMDVGFTEGFPYLMVEYAVNGSLRDRLNGQSPRLLPLKEAVTILSQVGEALHYAHQHQIIHRDLKPENILFNIQNEALLADFGIATMLSTASMKHTQVIGGTPPYMAPEQFKEGTISREGDQYALGCIAYELFTGRPPFTAPDFISMGYKHSTDPPVPPRQRNPNIPVHIEQAILKALAKQRADRYADVATFIRALQPSAAWEEQIATVPAARIPTQTSLPEVSQKSKEQWIDEGVVLYNLEMYV